MTTLLDAADVLTRQPGGRFEVVEAEVRGITTRVWRNAHASILDVLDQSRRYGDRDGVVFEDERLSFEEIARRAAALAHHLVDDFGVVKGDRVAVAMRNHPEWVVAFWGAFAAGAIVVPLNSWWSAEELAYGVEDSGASVLLTDGERLDRLRTVLSGLPLRTIAGRVGGGGVPAGVTAMDDLLTGPSSRPPIQVEPDDDATIMYTSGTTGRPKGAVATHRNICSNLMTMQYLGAAVALMSGPRAGEAPANRAVTLVPTPLFHVSGCYSSLLALAATGGTMVLMHKWDPVRALQLIERERVTTFGGVPAMVWQLLDCPALGNYDTSSLEGIGYGSAPAPPELQRRIGGSFPATASYVGYGLTETTSITSSNRGADYRRKPESVGPPVPVVEVQVVDEDGAELPAGAVGELLVKGPNVVRGYWCRPEETAQAFVDGWLHTGDLARLDDEGYICIVDRAKDMILRGGENVYCAEVEAALVEHPAVADVALIGVPDRVMGEEVGAVIQLRPGASLAATDVAAWLSGRIAAFKIPTRVWFRDDDLPRNPSGKVLKRELRAAVLSDDEARA